MEVRVLTFEETPVPSTKVVLEYRGTSLITKRPPPSERTVALWLGPYGGPRGGGGSYEPGTPVGPAQTQLL